MSSAFGIVGFLVYIACIVAAAASITWLVVRISPADKKPKAEPEPEPET